MNLQLTLPDGSYEAEYRTMIREVLAAGETRGYLVRGTEDTDFASYVQSLHDETAGIDLPEGRVPQTTYWLLENGVQIIGEIRLRHYLTPLLLQKGGNIGYMVRPAFRGRGCATYMVQQVLTKARD